MYASNALILATALYVCKNTVFKYNIYLNYNSILDGMHKLFVTGANFLVYTVWGYRFILQVNLMVLDGRKIAISSSYKIIQLMHFLKLSYGS